MTRHTHYVTAAALSVLQHKAYEKYTSAEEGDKLEFREWIKQRSEQIPHFQYWSLTLHLELNVLLLVRSQREGNFPLYVDALEAIVPWFFSLDHTNYARWLLVHIRDLSTLEVCHPQLYSEFCTGNFVTYKINHYFSAIALDQAHEQNNLLVKGSGGAVGLTENPVAFRRWMIAGPEISRLIEHFEESLNTQLTSSRNVHHHKQVPSIQGTFAEQTSSLFTAFEDLGNPFMEMISDLLAIHTNDIMPKEELPL